MHVPFIVAALAIALGGGFVLAMAMPLLGLLGIENAGRGAQAQAHGHLQTVGFAGLFIVGVVYHLLPAFTGGRPLPHPRLVTPSCWLIAGGVVARAAGQVAAPHPIGAVLLVAGLLGEIAGVCCFAANVVPPMRTAARRGDPTGLCFMAGALWFVLQASLAGWWLTESVLRGDAVLPAGRDALLVLLQFVGVHLMFIYGVGVRAFPVFFGARRITLSRIVVPVTIVQVALLLATVRQLLPPRLDGTRGWLFEDGALIAVGMASLWIVRLFGWWRAPSHVREVSRPFARLLQVALAWLAFAGCLAAVSGARALAARSTPQWNEVDALRHAVALGVVLTSMLAVGQMILPEFASERFAGQSSTSRARLLGGLIVVATLLRVGGGLLRASLPPLLLNSLLALSGLLAFAAVAVFAGLYWRGVRRHQALVARFAALAATGAAWDVQPRGTPSSESR